MSKHTPGPWEMCDGTSSIPIKGANGKTVCAIRYRENDLSDARLIAAAPEAVAIIEKYLACAANPHRVVLVDIDDDARALLARIKGEA